MDAITDYLPEIQEENVSESSRSSLSDQEMGFIQYDGSPSSSPTHTARSSDDYDISEIRVEVHKAATPPLLHGTMYRQPHPPPHPPKPRGCHHNYPQAVDVHFGPYYEERGEVSGHFDGVTRRHYDEAGAGVGHFKRDPLSSDLISPSSPHQRHLVKFRHRTSSSSHDSGISSQGTPQSGTPHASTPQPGKGDFVDMTGYEEEFMYSLDSRRNSTSSISSSSKSKPTSIKLKLGQDSEEDRQSLPLSGASTADSLAMSDNLADYGLCSPVLPHSPCTHTATTRKLTRRQFHHGYFVRARYSTKLHENKLSKTKHVSFKPPPSLCPSTRYSKEARSTAQKTKPKSPRRWPQPPHYPSKARHAATECEILRLVETLDLGVQCTADTAESHAQCTAATTDSATQYPRTRIKHGSTQTEEKSLADIGIQNVPCVRNRMVETSQRILYLPEINTAHAKVQTDNSTITMLLSTVQTHDRTASPEQTDSPVHRSTSSSTSLSCASQTSTCSQKPRKPSLRYQDSIDREKEKNKERLKEKETESTDTDYNYDSCSWSSGSDDEDSPRTCQS